MKNLFVKWLRILQNENYTGLLSESWASRKLICEVSIFIPKVLFLICIAGSKIQQFHISGFLSTVRNNKKIGTVLYSVCLFTFKFLAVASKFFQRYRGGIFLWCPVSSGHCKNSKISLELLGTHYIIPLHHVNKPGKFQRGIINPHLFTSICFQCGPTQPQNCP